MKPAPVVSAGYLASQPKIPGLTVPLDLLTVRTTTHAWWVGWVPKLFVVFNAGQVDELQPQHIGGLAGVGETEADIAATGATILHQGDQAFYMPRADVIQIPYRERFTTSAGYYSTVLHERSHWTGHPSRLNRDYGNRFGGDAYANEELIAELSAAILTARYQFANEARPDHARYLGQWMRVLNKDPRHLLTVANQAQAATDYILKTAPEASSRLLAALPDRRPGYEQQPRPNHRTPTGPGP